jgi:hypothetical protein
MREVNSSKFFLETMGLTVAISAFIATLIKKWMSHVSLPGYLLDLPGYPDRCGKLDRKHFAIS